MRELVARVTVLHKHDLTAEEVLKAAISEVHSTNLLHERILLASKLVEVNRCGERSEAKEAASKLDSMTSCWVVRASLARLSRELDAEGVREGADTPDPATELEIPLNCEISGSSGSEDREGKIQEGRADKIEKTDDETEITDGREKVGKHMMEKDFDNKESSEGDTVNVEGGPSEVDKGEECHWEPGKVQWLELMEGETQVSSEIIVILGNKLYQF